MITLLVLLRKIMGSLLCVVAGWLAGSLFVIATGAAVEWRHIHLHDLLILPYWMGLFCLAALLVAFLPVYLCSRWMSALWQQSWRAALLGKEVSPKALPQHKELKEKKVHAYYMDDTISTHQNQDRFKVFSADAKMPNQADEPGLQVLGERRLAMLRGRIKNRPQDPSANKVYRHGGLSLMELLTPWFILEKE